MSSAHPGRILPQDVESPDSKDDMLTALPVSQSEIEELLYGEDRTPAERIARLQELAEQMRSMEPADFGDGDPAALLGEIEAAIGRLSGDVADETEADFEAPTMDDDPLDHRETLAPDSDELEAIEEADAASFTDGSEPRDDAALDPEEWSEDDALDVDRAVR